MKNLLLLALNAILDRVDLSDALDVVFKRARFGDILARAYARAAEQIPQPILDRIDYLVRAVDGLDLPGEEKTKEVLAALFAPESPVRNYVVGVDGWLLHWAIKTAVARMRAQP